MGATNDSGTFHGVILNGSGTVALTKTGTGTETLSGASSYTGTTTVSGGTLSISADDNLGAVPGSATPGSLTLSGGTLATTASFTLNANRGISLGASGGTIDVASGTTLTYNGIVAGSGSLSLADTGTLVLGGANSYSGTTTISAGTLQVGAANAIPSTSDLTDNATLDLDGNSDTIGALSGSGTVTSSVAGSVTLTVGATNDDGTFSGVIQDTVDSPVALTKTGTGTETLSGANSYTGATTVSAGTLLVNGSLASGSAVSVSSGATLGGGTTTTSGTVGGTVSDSGTISPGPSYGSTGTGILDTGNTTFSSGSSFDVDLNGNAAGSGYDQLNVTGNAALGNGASTLNLSIGPEFSASVGATFVIINTTTGVSGTFSGLSEGSSIVVAGRKFTISYVGNSNNEVLLTYQQSTPTVTFSVNTAAGGTAMSSSNDITINYTSDGVAEQATIWDNHSFTGGVDTGSTVTFSADSSGSNGSERWQYDAAGDQPTFTVTGSTTLDVTYYDQLDDTFSASTAAGGTPMSTTNDITASYTQFNGALTQPIYDGTTATEWADRASAVTFSADSSGSASTERWQYNAHGDEPTFTVSDNTPLAAVYYDQLKLTVVSPHDTPSSSGTAFGSTSIGAGTSVYDDRGSTANATLESGSVVEGGNPYSFINWTGDASGTGLVSNNITIDGAKTATAVWKATSSLSKLSSPTITYGTATTLVSGNIAAGSLIPPGGESVSITINSVTQTASIGANGDFSSTFDTHALVAAKYTISYVYAGDGNFTAAAGSGALTVNPAFIFTPATLPVATVGDAYSQQITVSGGSGSGYSLTATGLPAGLSLTTLGLLSGTPTTAMGMPYTVTVAVTDGDGDTGGQIYPLTVKAAAVPGKIVSSLAHPYYGQEVTLTASFSATPAGSARMTGTVAFYDGNTYLGTEPLITSSAAALPAATVFMAAASPMVSGTSSLPTSSLSMGNHIITAVYSGDANYSTASSESSVSVQVVPAVTSVTLSASTTPQGTTLTAAVVVTSPGNPPAVGTVTFYDPGTPLGTVTVSNGVASLNVGVLSPGTYTFSAVFSGGGTFADSQSSLVVSTDGPKVTSVLRYGFHWQPTYLLINFNGPLDPTSAQNPSNYQILGPGGHRITVVSAIYDPATQTVTLVPAGRLNIHWKYRLTVNGTAPSGLTNPSGILLDGAGNGKPGSNYVTSITWRNLAGKASKLPTLVLVHAAPPRPVVTHTPPQHPKAALHTVAVDHLLVTESLHVRGVLRARR